MNLTILLFSFVVGIINVHSNEIKTSSLKDGSFIVSTDVKQETKELSNDATKDKRQITSRDTSLDQNHRSSSKSNNNNNNDLEEGHETIYGPKPNQFIIRPIVPHQHQQHESHQEPQLRNYPSTIRPYSSQLLEQSQEVQQFAYIQDISRNHSKPAEPIQIKQHILQLNKPKPTVLPRIPQLQQRQYSDVDGVERSFDIVLQSSYAPPLAQTNQYPPNKAFQSRPSSAQQLQQQHQQPRLQQLQQQYQIISEEHFLKLIEEELQERAYHDAKIHHQQQQQHHQQQQNQHQHQQQNQRQHYYQQHQQQQKPQQQKPQQQKQHQEHQQQQQHQEQQLQQQQQQKQQHQLPTTAISKILQPTDYNGIGLRSNRQRLAEDPSAEPEYVRYVPQHRGGERYFPLPNKSDEPQQQSLAENPLTERNLPVQIQKPEIPPQIAYFHPQISYKILPNHPLTKSSLEKEIEKLLDSNRPSTSTAYSKILDNSNEPTTAIKQHQQPLTRSTRPTSRPIYQQKSFISSTTPNLLLDANNQPFIPSLFKFSSYQEPTQIFPTHVPQHIIDAKKLGPVVYPTATPTQREQPPQTSQPTLSTQYYYQDAAPSNKAKPFHTKQFGNKVSTPDPQKFYDKPTAAPKYITTDQYYEYESVPQQQQHNSSPIQFYPSPPDPIKSQPPQKYPATPPNSRQPQPNLANYQQFSLTRNGPALSGATITSQPPPSQSSIFVYQGTGIATPSRVTTIKPKTAEDVSQFHLPPPGGKLLTQAEFQALVDAGYPVTAIPIPVPIPFEQYIKDHPNYRNQPIGYVKLIRLGIRQFLPQQRSLAVPSEPSVKIVSSTAESPTVTCIGGGSVTYLRPIKDEQKRHTRDEKDTKVAYKLEDVDKNPKG